MFGQRGPFRKTNRSAFANFLHSKYEMYTGENDVRSYPYYLTLEPSDRCQLRCPTCVTGIENEMRASRDPLAIFRSNRDALTHELLDSLLEEIGDYLFLIVFYNFGEPLLNKNLPGLIRKASARQIETDINTNLSLPLSDQHIENLLTSGLDYLYASIDGFSQKTYEIHRVGGNLELVKRNLERIVAVRDRLGTNTCIVYNFLVFSFNQHEVEAANRYCEDLGIHFNQRDAFIHDPKWLPTYRREEKPWIVPEEVSLPGRFGHKKNGVNLAWSPLPKPNASDPARCSWHYGYSAISAGGKVSPCCAVPGEWNDFGALIPGRVSFSEVWNNAAYRRSRADFMGRSIQELQETVCTRCPVPKFVHHMYSLHDYKVIVQAGKTIASDSLLMRAFDLFSQSRYGTGMHNLCPNGSELPEQFFGNEEESRIAAFVNFYRERVVADFESVHKNDSSEGLGRRMSC
jgi:MoaA/NifB/PqqE/SkfB family radical SAM enzyme